MILFTETNSSQRGLLRVSRNCSLYQFYSSSVKEGRMSSHIKRPTGVSTGAFVLTDWYLYFLWGFSLKKEIEISSSYPPPMPHRRMYSSHLIRCPEWGKNFITVALTTTHVLYMNLIIQNACLKMLIKTHLEIFWANQSIHCRPRNLHTFESTASALKLCLQASFVVVQLLSRVRLCDPMDSSMPGFPILLCLLEFA